MKTKTALIYGFNEPIKVEEVELDEPRPDEVLVKMVAAGICHSDWHLVTGDTPTPVPIALGHEGAGIVEKVGSEVTKVKPGDHVALTFIPSCGHCKWCIEGKSQLCDLGILLLQGTRPDGTQRLKTKNGEGVGQMCLVSTFSEYTLVSQDSICKIDPNYDLDKAALVSCGVATGYGAVVNRAKVTPGSTVLVVGVGGVGINVIQGAVASSASMIIAADVYDNKLEWAKEFGATHTINAKNDDIVSKVLEYTNGVGVDFAFEAIGTAATVGQAFAATSKGGTTVAIGVNPLANETAPINLFVLTLFQKALLGSIYGTSNPQTEIPKLLNLNKVGKLKLDELITKRYKLDDINEAYSDMLAGKNLRGMIVFD